MPRLIGYRSSSFIRGGVLLSALSLALMMTIAAIPLPAGAAEDWLKVEEEKPLYGDSKPAPRPKAAPAPGDAAPRADLQKEADAMKRYLKRFRDALAEAARLLNRRDLLVTDLVDQNDDFGRYAKKFNDNAKEMVEKIKKELEKYDPLVKKDPRFKSLDPGQDPGFKKRGDELIQNGGEMCRMAQKWAKSKKKRERDQLKADLKKLRDETKKKQDKLKADFQAMVSAMKPIYRALLAEQKKMTPQNKQKLIAEYGKIISAILDIHPILKDIHSTVDPFYEQLQKMHDASKMVLHYLDNNPKLPGVPNPQAIRNEVDADKAVKPLKDRANRLYQRETTCSDFAGWYKKLEDGPGIPAVKLARSTNNWVVVYSSSKDIFSLATNKMVDIMHRCKVVTDEIGQRKRLLDREWERSRDSLRTNWKCVKKWMSQKPTRYFKGDMQLDFSGRLIQPGTAAKCPARAARCGTVSAQMEAVADPDKQIVRIVAKAMPVPTIYSKEGVGLYCEAPKKKARYGYSLKYDPASGAINQKSKKRTITGRVSDSGLTFKEHRIFQSSGSRCGVAEFLVQVKGNLKQAAPGEETRALEYLETTGDELSPLAGPSEGISALP